MMAKTFRVQIVATRTLEITLDEDDLDAGESFEVAAQLYAMENAFLYRDDDKVMIEEDWDITPESTLEVVPA
jgi:hypothetical protein